MKKKSILRSTHQYIRRYWQLWLLLLPAIIYVIIFSYVPMFGIRLAFHQYNFREGLFGGKFVGLEYFKQYFRSPMFLTTLRNTFTISLTSILVGFPAPIILAMVINQQRNRTWQRVVQTTVTLPYFISVVVLVSMLKILLATNTGIINIMLEKIGFIPESANLLGSSKYFIPVYVLSGVWQAAGWNSVIYLSTLASVDTNLYDAAAIDGASRFQTMWHIDLPVIKTTAIILLILSMGGILNVGFDKIYLMQNSLNRGSSEVISTYVFSVGVTSSQFAYGTAIGLFNNIVNFIFLLTTNLITRKISDISLV